MNMKKIIALMLALLMCVASLTLIVSCTGGAGDDNGDDKGNDSGDDKGDETLAALTDASLAALIASLSETNCTANMTYVMTGVVEGETMTETQNTTIKYTENAVYARNWSERGSNETYVVLKDGKWCTVSEVDGAWVVVNKSDELNNFDLSAGLGDDTVGKAEDYTYDATLGAYVTEKMITNAHEKDKEGYEPEYGHCEIYVADGKLAKLVAKYQQTMPSGEGQTVDIDIVVTYNISDRGTTVVTVPEYTEREAEA